VIHDVITMAVRFFRRFVYVSRMSHQF
jgi:hypothetical protein